MSKKKKKWFACHPTEKPRKKPRTSDRGTRREQNENKTKRNNKHCSVGEMPIFLIPTVCLRLLRVPQTTKKQNQTKEDEKNAIATAR
jgi:hypothetical protein